MFKSLRFLMTIFILLKTTDSNLRLCYSPKICIASFKTNSNDFEGKCIRHDIIFSERFLRFRKNHRFTSLLSQSSDCQMMLSNPGVYANLKPIHRTPSAVPTRGKHLQTNTRDLFGKWGADGTVHT